MADLFDITPSLSLLPKLSPVSKPPKIELALWRVIEAAARVISLGEPLTSAIVGPEMRRQIEARRRLLTERRRPGSPAEISDALATLVDMRSGFRPANREQSDWFTKLRIGDLADLPLWALWEAVDDYRRAKIGAGALKPTCGQIRKRALECARGLSDEEMLIERVLKEPIVSEPSEEDRARRKEVLNRLKAISFGLKSA